MKNDQRAMSHGSQLNKGKTEIIKNSGQMVMNQITSG